ncbi:MAG: endonuclease III [Gemmatimonadota bacterium]|nr:endonuclease III [Gemmatimonadota bacterium]
MSTKRRTARVAPARERIGPIVARLTARYPEARCSLGFGSPLELLVATILSAQCTDERVNMVTPTLFRRYPTARDYADANPEALADIIRTTGFFRNKTKALIGMGQALCERHGGAVPRSMAELTAVPGVGRKTANVVLGNAFGIDEGVVVDTHVKRLTHRLGLTRQTDPVKIERDLMAVVPRSQWTLFPHLMIHHGRAICQARKPKCEICPVNDLCPVPGGRTT